MKPLKLSMSAFGPYAGPQVLDFTELGDRSFFVIHGPTGAGKTTILDAMCFALYGDTSGARRDGKQMRSDHAEPSVVTEVVFDFSIGSASYRIQRRPEQERPKLRGEGTTVMRSEATLWDITGIGNEAKEGAVLESGWSKVTAAVEKLLGFKSEQFRQVVMLPQGDFQKLLMADSRERQAILEILFHTELYRRIEESLKEAARVLKKDVEKTRQQRNWVLQEAGSQTREELAGRLQKHREELHAAGQKVACGRAMVKKAQEALAAGQQAREKLEEERQARAAVAGLESRAPEIAARRQALDKARRAAGLLDAESALQARQQEVSAAEKVLALKSEALNRACAAKEMAEKKFALEKDRESEREAAAREVARLEELGDKVRSLAGAREAVVKAQTQYKVAENKYNKVRQFLNSTQLLIEEKNKLYDEAVKLAARRDALESALREAERLFIKRQALEAQRRELSVILKDFRIAGQKLQHAEENYARVKKQLTAMQEAWHRGQAAVLAGSLKRGVPCPVCGSLEHPAPAREKAKLPSEEEIKAGQQQLNNLEKYRDQVKDKFNALVAKKATVESKVRDLEAELGDKAGVDLPVLQADAQKAGQLLSGALAAVKKVDLLAGELAELKEQEKKTGEQLDILQKARQEAGMALEAARAVVWERESGIPKELRDLNALNEARRAAGKKKERLMAAFEQSRLAVDEANQALARAETAAQGSREALQEAQKRAAGEAHSFAARLQAMGFADPAEYAAAKKTQEEILALEKQIKEYDDNFRAALDRRERAIKAAEGLSEPDMKKLTRALTLAEQARDEALQLETRLRSQIEQESNWLKQIVDLDSALEEMEGRYSVLGHLSDVANGKNDYGLTFQRFVLGALLDDVTVAATERLKLMSRGRYHLQRTLERSRSNAAGGLELEVFDTYTGMARQVSTLSGGESFLAALSLALGLADVVQSYAGGMHLDTVFIDEGFGTLDPESLDLAMRALIDLQKGGRLVGIISHVPELKEIIDARLEVRATKKGSTARFMFS
jgi:exonuclease SbcC